MWNRFYQHIKQDLKLWLCLVALQQICRLLFIVSLKKFWLEIPTWQDIGLTMLVGLRFDTQCATVAILLPLVVITLPATFISRYQQSTFALNFRWLFAVLCGFVIIAIYCVSIEYYNEYQDIFNQFIFGLIYDDRTAIFETIWAEDYLLKYAIIALVAITATIWFTRKLFTIKKLVHPKPLWLKTILTLLVVVFYLGAFRGGLGNRPVQLKDAAVLRDPFLSKAVISPFIALKYAIKERRLIERNDYGKQFIANNKIVDLLKAKFKTTTQLADFDSYLQRSASGWTSKLNIPRAKHVFVIVGESYDAWSLQPKYKHLNLSNELQKIAANGGISLSNFLPAADGTIAAANTILSGLLETEIMINYQPNSRQAYPTAPAVHFKQLGYQTNFFYGGYLSWQKLGDFAKHQGFDHVYGAAHMGNWLASHEWGVDDADLYDFILTTLNDDVPSYNVILTTSNHPPFSVDLERAGIDLAYIREEMKHYPNSPATAEQLGHLVYADRSIGKFVQQAEEKLKYSLFAITGDHFGRRHVLANPPAFEKAAVPLVLYGKGITDRLSLPDNIAGSHVDIGPTLIELIAPQGFTYHALGNNLFAEQGTEFGFNKRYIISKKFGVVNANSNSAEFKALIEMHRQNIGLSWWRVVKGNLFEG